jgi:DNA-binding FadR family transcriptional regulator
MSTPTTRARIVRGMTEPSALARILEEHRAIYNAMMAWNAELARSWAAVHIGGIQSWLRTTVDTRSPNSRRSRGARD